MSGKYDDIIGLPHHVSATRPHMPLLDRAAQFAPFAALTGHDAAARETARLTQSKAELGEDAIALLNEQLHLIQLRIEEQPVVTLTYYLPDAKKTGGAYLTVAGAVKKIDEVERVVITQDKTAISIDAILNIEIHG